MTKFSCATWCGCTRFLASTFQQQGSHMSRPGLLRRLPVALGVAAAAALALVPATTAVAGTVKPATYNQHKIPVQLLSFNDYHGHLEQDAGSDGSVPFEGASVAANGA